MPDKPLWLDRLPGALRQLEDSAEPWIDRAAVELLLGVGRRRAQQLLAPIAKRRVGTSVVAQRADLIHHLKRVAAGEQAYYEDLRRKQFCAHLAQARREWVEQPSLLVEMSSAQARRLELEDLEGLPAGIELAPGSITVRFADPGEALQKLMALTVAVSHNRQAFEARVALPSTD